MRELADERAMFDPPVLRHAAAVLLPPPRAMFDPPPALRHAAAELLPPPRAMFDPSASGAAPWWSKGGVRAARARRCCRRRRPCTCGAAARARRCLCRRTWAAKGLLQWAEGAPGGSQCCWGHAGRAWPQACTNAPRSRNGSPNRSPTSGHGSRGSELLLPSTHWQTSSSIRLGP